MFRSWQLFANDPDDQVADWLEAGGPCGIELRAKNVGVFPEAEGQDYDDPHVLLENDPLTWETKLAEDEIAYLEMETLTKKGYVLKFPSLKAAQEHLGSNIVASKLIRFC